MSNSSEPQPSPTAIQVATPSTPATPLPVASAEDKEFERVAHLIAQVAPPFAQLAATNSEQETKRQENLLRLWSRPLLCIIGGLGFGILVLATVAILKDKENFALTVVGYFLTYLGGIGTAQVFKPKQP